MTIAKPFKGKEEKSLRVFEKKIYTKYVNAIVHIKGLVMYKEFL